MTQHIPDIEFDPQFQSRLKDNLRYHLVSQYAPQPQINVWQKFFLYGLPSLAIGIALLYVLPWMPGTTQITVPEDSVTDTGVIQDENIDSGENVIESTDPMMTLPSSDTTTVV
jgi:hypothetical protein